MTCPHATASTAAHTSPRRVRPKGNPRETDFADTRFLLRQMSPFLSFGAVTANLVMQLSHPGVGYGVIESTVDSGNLHKRPFKRARTTIAYLAIAMYGSARDRHMYRTAVNGAHRFVRSDENSPVKYNAFDPELQLWVAACLYQAFEDTYRIEGHVSADAEEIYQAASVLATTLQVPRDLWPATRADFHEYWHTSLAEREIDETVRRFLLGLCVMDFLPFRLPGPVARLSIFHTAGFLPAELRTLMHLRWTEREQRRFDRHLSVFRFLDRLIPRWIMAAGSTLLLWDTRFRHTVGLRVV